MFRELMVLCPIMLALSILADVPIASSTKRVKRPAKVTSDHTYYDRKEGIAVFTGKVHVDDEEYQMHADKAFVFMSGTNELKRLVAIGNVALTNGNRRAYGNKASYYRQNGLVILYAPTNGLAEVREDKQDGMTGRSVKGTKMKFWINSEQVEVIGGVGSFETQDAGTNGLDLFGSGNGGNGK